MVPWIVREIGFVLPTPFGTIHHIVVSSLQSCMPTIAVDPSLARYVVAACPKLTPSSEIPAYWLHTTFAGPAIETLGVSYDRTLVIVPAVNPDVTTWETLPLVPLEARHIIDVCDAHDVNSPVLTPTVILNVRSAIPRLYAETLSTIEPVAATFNRDNAIEP